MAWTARWVKQGSATTSKALKGGVLSRPLPAIGLAAGLVSLSINILCADTVTQPARTFGFGTITTATLSPDGTQFATAGSTGVLVRDLATGDFKRSWVAANASSVAFSPDGKQLLAGFGGRGVTSSSLPAKLWDVATGELVRTLDGAYHAVAFAKDGSKYVAGSYTYSNNVPVNARAVVFAADSGQPLMAFNIGNESLFGVAISPDGTRVLTAGGKVRLWDLASGQLQHTWGETNDYFYSAAFSPDGSQVVAGAQAQMVFSTQGVSSTPALMLWDVASGQLVRNFEDPNSHYDDAGGGAVRALAFSPDGSQLAFGTGEWWDYFAGDIHFVNLSSGLPITKISSANLGDICYLAYTPDGKKLLSAAAVSGGGTISEDSAVKLWDLAERKLEKGYTGYYRDMECAALSADGTTVVTGDRANSVACSWDAKTGQVRANVGLQGTLISASLSSDGSTALLAYYVYADTSAAPCVVDCRTGNIIHQFTNASGFVFPVAALSGNGQRVFLSNGSLAGWLNATNGEVLNATVFSELPTAICASESGTVVVAAYNNGSAQLIDAYSGAVRATFTANTNRLTSVALSADRTRVVTGSTDGKAWLWDAASGQMLFEFAGHSGGVNAVAISSNGQWIVTGGADQTAKVWDGLSGQLRRTLAGHSRGVASVGISADGTQVLTCGSYAQAYLWDTSDLKASLAISQTGGKVVLQWPQGTLQMRSEVKGTWQDVAGATSPYTVPAGTAVQFFRLK